MKRFSIPKGLLFKEWKEHRWWMIAGFILMLAQPLIPWFGVVLGPGMNVNGTTVTSSSTPSGTSTSIAVHGIGVPLSLHAALFWKVLVPAVYGAQIAPNSSGYPTAYSLSGIPYLSYLSGLAAMGLIIALVTVERNRGALWFTLSGPVTRRSQIQTKVLLTAGIVLITLVIKLVLLLGTDLYIGTIVPLPMLVRWVLANAMFELGLLAIGLACASVVMVGMAAGLWALLITGIPWAVARSILPVVPPPSSTTNAKVLVAERVTQFVQSLSPWHYSSPSLHTGVSDGAPVGWTMHIGQSGPPLAIMAIWFIVWVAVWGWLGYKAYLNAPLENSNQFFLFSRLWIPALWILTALVSYVVVNSVLTRGGLTTVAPFMMFVRVLEVWIPLSVAMSLLITVWLRRPVATRRKVTP